MKSVDRQAYEQSLKYYRDMKNVISTAVKEGTGALREEMTLALNEERRQKELLKEKLMASGMTEGKIQTLLKG